MSRESGIKKVIDNNPTDHAAILVFAREWVKLQMKEFTADDLRNAYEAVNKAPEQPKIYGGVFNTLLSERAIKHHGYSTSKRPEAHSRLIRTWISLVYSEKQASNRRKPNEQINLFDL